MHLTEEALLAARSHLVAAPTDLGRLELIVARPEPGQRRLLDEARLDLVDGLVGDNWLARGNRHRDDGSADPDAQITVMNIRVADLVADSHERIPLAGDQLYVDMDLSIDNLPVGTRLTVGSAVLLVTAPPHTGCAKFVERFGTDAMRFVNSREGRAHRWRGMNTRVLTAGVIRTGDVVSADRATPDTPVPQQAAAGLEESASAAGT